jgi:hypothetical protein
MAALLSLAFTPNLIPANTSVRVWASRPISQGRAERPDFFLLLTIKAGPIPGAGPLNLGSLYTAKFGALIAGQRIWFRMERFGRFGIRGPSLEQSVIVG